ncbi:MAG: hypothetical protein M5U01_18245 [Ardenticatenaceae bacterium]|nr:hypothetical protein [Ardenticatenaceae bacterium]
MLAPTGEVAETTHRVVSPTPGSPFFVVRARRINATLREAVRVATGRDPHRGAAIIDRRDVKTTESAVTRGFG